MKLLNYPRNINNKTKEGNNMKVGDPNDDMNKAIDQWLAAGQKYNLDSEQLVMMIQELEKLIKAGKTGAAFQMAQNQIMPATMNLKGDEMKKLAATMNVASAMQEFTTEAQKDMNAGAGMTPAQGDEFVKMIKDFISRVDGSDAIDANTKAQLDAAINHIAQSFGCKDVNDNNFTGDKIAQMIKHWTLEPNSTQNGEFPNPGGKTGQQCLQDLQSGFTQWNNTQSAQSQVLQAEVQFSTNTYNQFMNTLKAMEQAAVQQGERMVQNQKAQ